MTLYKKINIYCIATNKILIKFQINSLKLSQIKALYYVNINEKCCNTKK